MPKYIIKHDCKKEYEYNELLYGNKSYFLHDADNKHGIWQKK